MTLDFTSSSTIIALIAALISLWNVFVNRRQSDATSTQAAVASTQQRLEEMDRLYSLRIAALTDQAKRLEIECESLKVLSAQWQRSAESFRHHADECKEELAILRREIHRGHP